MSADAFIARRGFRQVWKGATVCAVVVGGTVASSAISYVTTFPTEAGRQQLAAATSGDTGFAIVMGPTSAIDTVGGYTVYKCYVFGTAVLAIWALLAATRLLRGEEDAGRWQVMLAGSTRPARATAAMLVALGSGVGIIFVVTTLLTLLAAQNPDIGFSARATVLYGLSLTIAAAVFAAVGAFTSQLGRTRRMATGLGMAVLGVTFVLRMVADSGPSTQWLLWATPFGWIELMRPFTENNVLPLLPAAVTLVLLCVGAVVLASRRDAGDGVLAGRDVATLRPVGLRSPFGLVARLEFGVLVAWCVGIVAGALVFGIIAKLTTQSIPQSMSDTLDKFGVQGSFVYQYFGIVFLLEASIIALLPAGQVGAASAEETSGRLVHVLSRPPRRTVWFGGRLALCAIGIVAACVLTGLGAWAGARSQGVDVGIGPMLGAGLNIIPIALVALGIGAVVLAVAPRAAAATVYGVVAWSLVVYLVGSLVTGTRWLERTSLFNYMQLAPAQDPDPKTLAITTVIAVVLCIVATAVFDRRDMRTA